MPKPIFIQHGCPKEGKPFAILPIGMYCNSGLQKANPGDTIIFCQDWRREKAVLVRHCRIAVNSSVFTFMAKSIYGEYTRIKDLLAKWEALSVVEGYGKEGYSKDECLLIECKLIEE